eukprot:3360220-Rhodomonas_salina.1
MVLRSVSSVKPACGRGADSQRAPSAGMHTITTKCWYACYYYPTPCLLCGPNLASYTMHLHLYNAGYDPTSVLTLLCSYQRQCNHVSGGCQCDCTLSVQLCS